MRGTETLRKRLACIHDEQTRPRCGVVLVHPDGTRTWNDGSPFDPRHAGAILEMPAPMDEAQWEKLAIELGVDISK